jgi:hypothetical protein
MKILSSKIYSKNAIVLLVLTISFRFLLEISYSEFISKVFYFEGYKFDFSLVKYIESWILLFLIIFLAPKAFNKPSDLFLALIVYSSLIPLLVYYALASADRLVIYFIFFTFLIILIFRHGRRLHLKNIKNGPVVAYIISIAGISISTIWLFYIGGLQFFNLDFDLVYEYREISTDIIDAGLMGYINSWAIKSFGPLLLALSLWRKNIFLFIMIYGLHILWFGMTSHKSIIFFPFLIIFVWLFFRKNNSLSIFPVLFTLIILFGYFIYIYFNDIWVGSMLIRRVFFVPAKLTFDYYNFFSNNQFIYWSNSITSIFVAYPYNIAPPQLIGEYLGDSTQWANNSFFSTGYMHAGGLGMFFYGVLVGLLFKIIDSLSFENLPAWFSVSILIVPTYVLISSADFFVAFLTHGYFVSLIIMIFIRSKK